MTEQEKQIEEMAKLVCGMPKELDCKKCIEQDGFHKCSAIRAGRELFDAGCRKIPYDAVVLNIGKNNEALDEKTIEFFVKHNAKVRKETAREIATWFESISLGGQIIGNRIREKYEVDE